MHKHPCTCLLAYECVHKNKSGRNLSQCYLFQTRYGTAHKNNTAINKASKQSASYSLHLLALAQRVLLMPAHTHTGFHTSTSLTSTYTCSKPHVVSIVTFQPFMVVAGLMGAAVLVELSGTHFTAAAAVRHQAYTSGANRATWWAFTHRRATGINLGDKQRRVEMDGVMDRSMDGCVEVIQE